MPNEHEVELIRYALEQQSSRAEQFVEANADPVLLSLGNAAIANALERLGAVGIVADVRPTFGTGGLGFAYRLNLEACSSLTHHQSIVEFVEDVLAGGADETSASLGRLIRQCKQHPINPVYADDLLATLQELRSCFSNECYIACLALSGKLLEICLKQILLSMQIDFDEHWMIGRLLRELRERDPLRYLDQSLGDVANVINKSRIPAVHSVERVPVPSRDQAIMVIHAVVDTINRTLLSL